MDEVTKWSAIIAALGTLFGVLLTKTAELLSKRSTSMIEAQRAEHMLRLEAAQAQAQSQQEQAKAIIQGYLAAMSEQSKRIEEQSKRIDLQDALLEKSAEARGKQERIAMELEAAKREIESLRHSRHDHNDKLHELQLRQEVQDKVVQKVVATQTAESTPDSFPTSNPFPQDNQP
jgi:type I site-specific restriction endonuclease